MAKYNMMLGVAAGSVGDIVLSRQNGKQIQRVRVHEVANPKTEGQAAQRSFVAPVTKFYSPLAIALERSWQAMNKGQSYSAFLKFNTQLARDRQWALPKGTGFFPLPFRVSHGTLPALSQGIAFAEGVGTFWVNGGALTSIPSSLTVGAFSQSFIKAGYSAHDQITVIMVTQNNFDDIYAQDAFTPTYIRFYLDPNSNQLLTDLGLQDPTVSLGGQWSFNQSGCVAVCFIVSRYERGVWRRSTQALMVVDDIMSVIETPSERQQNINTYRPPMQANVSDIYLNGSSGNDVVLERTTRANVPVNIVAIRKAQPWAVAVSDDDLTYFVYSDDRHAPSYQKCLKSDGTWETNDAVNAANSIGFSFMPNAENGEENLLFFMAAGFTYNELMDFE